MKRNLLAAICVLLVSQFITPSCSAAEYSPEQHMPVSYELSYPGLLPGHPLYVLKQFRDNMLTFFIGKPLDKAAFMLLQADKQVAAAQLLHTQNRDIHTIIDVLAGAQKDMEDSIRAVKDAKQEGYSTQEIINQLQTASKKHQEIMQSIITSIPQHDQQSFSELEKKTASFVDETASLRS